MAVATACLHSRSFPDICTDRRCVISREARLFFSDLEPRKQTVAHVANADLVTLLPLISWIHRRTIDSTSNLIYWKAERHNNKRIALASFEFPHSSWGHRLSENQTMASEYQMSLPYPNHSLSQMTSSQAPKTRQAQAHLDANAIMADNERVSGARQKVLVVS